MRRLSLAPLVAALLVASPAAAQTYNWTGGGGNGNWNTALNWDIGIPASASDTIINLGGTTQTTTNQNVASPFVLNQLNVLADATSGFVVNGGPLQFTGGGAQIRNAAASLLQVNTAVTFAANTTIDMRANNVGVREAQFTGPLTAAAGITVTVTSSNLIPGTITVFQGTNYGFLGTVNVANNSIVHTTGANTLARSATVTTTGTSSTYMVGTLSASGLTATGAGVQLATVAGDGEFSLGDASITSAALVGFNNALANYQGNVTAGNANSHLAKVGTGEWRFNGSGASPVTGSVSVRDGVLNFSSGSGSIGGFGTTSTGRVQVYGGGQMWLTMSSGTGDNGRIGDTQPITLQGGVLLLNAAGQGTSGTGFTEVAGALTVGAGQSTVRIDTATGRGTRFSFTSLTAPSSATGTVTFLSNNLGASDFNTAGAGNITFVSAPTGQFVGTTTAYGANTKDLAILPYATGGTVSGGLPATFVAYDTNTVSVRGLGDANYDASFVAATSNVSLSGTTIVGTTTTANAVRMTDTGTVVNNSTLTITSGALLFTGSTGNGISGSGQTAFGAGGSRTAFITATAGTSTISGPILAANLSKNGAGGLTLGGTTTLTGTAGNTVAVNAGTLTLGAGSSVATANALSATNTLTYQVSRGAALDVSANGLTVGNFTTLTGGAGTAATGVTNQGRVVGNVTVNSGGTVAPSALGGPRADLLSPGTLNVSGTLALNGGSNYVWAVNSAVTNGDNTVAPTSGTLNNFRSPYTASLLSVGTLDLSGASSANRINLRLTSLGLSNDAGAVYDLFDGTNRSWVLVDATTITGFSADKFTFDVSAFQGVPADQLSISQVGNSLVLTFSPVPEPASMLAVAAAVTGVGVAWRRFRRRTPAATPAPTTAV
jgi:fibronectin-binding autotransporter adhesin